MRGSIAQWTAFLLRVQRPRVRFSVKFIDSTLLRGWAVQSLIDDRTHLVIVNGSYYSKNTKHDNDWKVQWCFVTHEKRKRIFQLSQARFAIIAFVLVLSAIVTTNNILFLKMFLHKSRDHRKSAWAWTRAPQKSHNEKSPIVKSSELNADLKVILAAYWMYRSFHRNFNVSLTLVSGI